MYTVLHTKHIAHYVQIGCVPTSASPKPINTAPYGLAAEQLTVFSHMPGGAVVKIVDFSMLTPVTF